MASEVRSFDVTFPAGTSADTPVTVDTTFPDRIVSGLIIKVPPGPSGLAGFRFGMAGRQVLPINLGSWIISDDDLITMTLTGLPESGQWYIEGYNTDIYDHTIYVTYLLEQVTQPAPNTQGTSGNQVSTQILGMSGS